MTSKPFLVNSNPVYYQKDPSIATLVDGSFVVTWSSSGQDAGDNSAYSGIYGQRFSRTGAKIGVEFHVNTGVARNQSHSSIASLADGGFVVVWASDTPGSSDYSDIFGQRYDANGVVVGGEFRINGYPADSAIIASLAATRLLDGGFVVTWAANASPGEQISGRRYDSNGVGGNEFKVNTFFQTSLSKPATTYLANGGWVVTWASYGQDGDSFGVYGQRYNSSGVVAGSEFLINTYVSGSQDNSQVITMADGGFLVVWNSDAPNNRGIYTQRFDTNGNNVGGEIQITNEFAIPKVTVLNDGGALVTWKSSNVYSSVQRLDASGNKSGPTSFLINSSPNVYGITDSPVISTLPDGRVVLAWAGSFNGGTSVDINGIVARILDTSIKNDFGNDRKSDILWRNTNGAIALWQMNGNSIQSSTAIATLGNDWIIQDVGDFGGDGKSDILWRNTNGAIALWQMNGNSIQSSTAIATLGNDWIIQDVGDFGGDGKSDILWRNTNGAVALWQMNGNSILSSTALGNIGNDWVIKGVDDFNGDGRADILWKNTNGAVALWQMNGNSILSSTALGNIGNDWVFSGSGDYNGDNVLDVLWRNNDGRIVTWQMNDGAIASSTLISQLDSSWQIATS
jgi:FG-GAP-like repeat